MITDKHARILRFEQSLAEAVGENVRLSQALEAERMLQIRNKRQAQEAQER